MYQPRAGNFPSCAAVRLQLPRWHYEYYSIGAISSLNLGALYLTPCPICKRLGRSIDSGT